ncbi:MAG TPA: hypothetical protein PK861_02605 [Thermomonas sp.]|nr:hypothetical protein [Thermomonas sp.]
MLLLLFRRAVRRVNRGRIALADAALWAVAVADAPVAALALSDAAINGLAVGDAP